MITQNDINFMIAAANLTGFQVQSNQIQFMTLDAGIDTHVQLELPNGMQAVYIFKYEDIYLKVGKAGIFNKARYRSHHYKHIYANNNLALSLIIDPEIITPEADFINIWIRENTTRFNLLIDVNLGVNFLNFMEAFFILKCDPKY